MLLLLFPDSFGCICLHLEVSSRIDSWPLDLVWFIDMGNKPAKQEREEILVKAVPPLDQALVRWLARDVERVHGFAPKNPRAIEPPAHYIKCMRLHGLLDLDLDDPDLAHLFK